MNVPTLDATTIPPFRALITSMDGKKPVKGSEYFNKQLQIYIPELYALNEKGFSVEQLFDNYPVADLTEIEMDKKTFISKLRAAIKKHKKTLELTPAPAPTAADTTASDAAVKPPAAVIIKSKSDGSENLV